MKWRHKDLKSKIWFKRREKRNETVIWKRKMKKVKEFRHKEKIRYTKEENNNVMSRYDHKIETSLEGIEHLSKEKKEEIERKMKEKNNYWPKVRDSKLLDF